VLQPQRDLAPASLTAAVDDLLTNAARRTAMCASMASFARPYAAAHIVDRVLALKAAA
jgi:UDP-N-acetylglucosamine:LPS N-acetylglucosamine transferase